MESMSELSRLMNLSGDQNGSLPRRPLTVLLTDFPYLLLVALAVVMEAGSLLINYCVLKATLKVSVNELKSKYLLVNALVIDMWLPLGTNMVALLYVAIVAGLRDNYARACLDGMVAIFSPLFQYAQSVSSLFLVCDRLYAIVVPLTYHIVSYPKMASICLISAVWIVSAGLIVPMFYLAKEATEEGGICWGIAQGHREWNNVLRFPVVITIHVLVFCIYILLFALVKWRRSPTQTYSNSHEITVKESVSLALTFFVVHLSSLCLYIPGPIFALVMASGRLALDHVTLWRIRRALILLYLLNSVVNPLIMATRIPAIRRRLLRSWYRRQPASSRRRYSSTKIEDISMDSVNKY